MGRPIFRYSPINLAKDAIRLVHLFKGYDSDPIECQIYETFLHEAKGVPYEALSYTWGQLDKPNHIILNGCLAPITANLESALRCLRHRHQDRILWIDAICIDQENAKEQGHQVGQMKCIYTYAEHVIIWLGMSNSKIEYLMDCMNQVNQEGIDTEATRGDSLESWQMAWPILYPQLDGTEKQLRTWLKASLEELLINPWFRRVWIIQEVASARTATIVCGRKSISTKVFTRIPPLLGIDPEPHTQAVLDVMPGPLRQTTWWSTSQNLSTLIQKFYLSEASDPRDKIYALLGMSDGYDVNKFCPSYERSMQEVTKDTISFMLFNEVVDHSTYGLPDWTLEDLVHGVGDLPYRVFEWALEKRCLKKDETPEATCRKLVVENRIDAKKTHFRFSAETLRTLQSASTPLAFFEAVWGDSEVAKIILANDNGILNLRAPLAAAARTGNAMMVEFLLSKDIVNVNHDSPLSWAATGGYEKITRILLAHKNIDVNYGSALSKAMKKGREGIVRMLLASPSIDVNLGSPLSTAAKSNLKELVQILLAHKNTNVNLNSPLCKAIRDGHELVVEMLLAHGETDVNLPASLSPNTTPISPLSMALIRGRDSIVDMLLAHEKVCVNNDSIIQEVDKYASEMAAQEKPSLIHDKRSKRSQREISRMLLAKNVIGTESKEKPSYQTAFETMLSQPVVS